MLVKDFTLTGTRNEFTITVPTIYKFMTVFNHSRHRLQFFPDTNIDLRQMLYRVPSQIYLTLPLTLSGEVETCQRLTTYTMVSEGENIAPTNISIMFSEQMENINLPFPDPIEKEDILNPENYYPPHLIPYNVNVLNSPLPIIVSMKLKRDVINTASPLTSSASISFDINTSSLDIIRLRAFSNVAGEIRILESHDLINFDLKETHVVSANTPFFLSYTPFLNQVRVTYLNGVTAQTIFRFNGLGCIL